MSACLLSSVCFFISFFPNAEVAVPFVTVAATALFVFVTVAVKAVADVTVDVVNVLLMMQSCFTSAAVVDIVVVVTVVVDVDVVVVVIAAVVHVVVGVLRITLVDCNLTWRSSVSLLARSAHMFTSFVCSYCCIVVYSYYVVYSLLLSTSAKTQCNFMP